MAFEAKVCDTDPLDLERYAGRWYEVARFPVARLVPLAGLAAPAGPP